MSRHLCRALMAATLLVTVPTSVALAQAGRGHGAPHAAAPAMPHAAAPAMHAAPAMPHVAPAMPHVSAAPRMAPHIAVAPHMAAPRAAPHFAAAPAPRMAEPRGGPRFATSHGAPSRVVERDRPHGGPIAASRAQRFSAER